MGEVYRARDTRLEREVALKILPEALVEDAEHLARFEREARLLAMLNHPNVATIHGLDQAGGIHFLVLELVPGETLRDRLARGPMSIAEAVGVQLPPVRLHADLVGAVAQRVEEEAREVIVDLKAGRQQLIAETVDVEVAVVDNGIEALILVGSFQPDLVVLAI